MAIRADRLPGGLDQLGGPVYAFYGVTPAHELAGISACSAAGIEQRRARKDATLVEPVCDRGAVLTNRTVDQQIERPRVLAVERATDWLGLAPASYNNAGGNARGRCPLRSAQPCVVY